MTITEENSEAFMQIKVDEGEQTQVIKEAMLALEALGYSKRELSKVEKVLKKQMPNSVDEAVKVGLRTLIS